MRLARPLFATATGAALLAALGVGCGSSSWQPAPCPSCPDVKFPAPTTQPVVGPAPAPTTGEPTVGEAKAFIAQVDKDLRRLFSERERAGWVKANFITSDTEAMAEQTDQATMEYLAKTIKAARRFDKLTLPPEVRRQFLLLKLAGTMPAPADSAKAAELARLGSSMASRYSKGKYCPVEGGKLRKGLAKSKDNAEALQCKPGQPDKGIALDTLRAFMAENREPGALAEAWIGWHSISPPMRDEYARFVELGNEGAREIGFKDIGDLWRSGYDMPAEDFRAEAERLWNQVKPFYEELHCYVRKRLREKYGNDVVPEGKPIPAHLLGNMWSQEWSNVYELVEPFKGQGMPNVTRALKQKRYTEKGMVELAEKFFVSLGLDELPDTFWERSLFIKPKDREVECHASAWDVSYDGDLRIKMCIQINEEDLQVVHHELGHNYYYQNYFKLPMLFQQGANDGFHEAIGDAIALSITPGYLKQVGLIDKVADNDKAEINFLMKMALDKIAFLPFGKLIDQWRWDVFAGKTSPSAYNRAWWDLRTKYQGIAPPNERSEEHFDPGAKYHVPANVPYTRYFLAFIYQFQFQRALCREAGHQGPLHKCSIFNNKAAGAKLQALLALGASKPWQEALFAMTGERQGDASAILDYFAPMRTWLAQQNKGETCGW
jgi:peptidyl-dipeptidase A